MENSLESKEQQLAVIEANAEKIAAIAHQGYQLLSEKGTVIIFRQLEENSTVLADWQVKFKPMSQIGTMISDWQQAGLGNLIDNYNPKVAVVCTFLYPNGSHTSYHFQME
ncbi:MAG: hypothetical protein F6K18_29725 [Okeania sp. SIO2C2]|uniref:hypothetical protein n=1 Tax=Okeania sp. SIO2C2 TaxID=2607787 RepID=UPI0013BD615B|nr:hypothetical protein [Okeania sp. SIO2C2]NEP90661.1 hypothetical protein [Okeania sp. SIO2C2]